MSDDGSGTVEYNDASERGGRMSWLLFCLFEERCVPTQEISRLLPRIRQDLDSDWLTARQAQSWQLEELLEGMVFHIDRQLLSSIDLFRQHVSPYVESYH